MVEKGMVEKELARIRRRDHSIEVTDSSEEEGWLITYLDMITLILVMVVVMLALSGGKIVHDPASADNVPHQSPPLPVTQQLPAGDGLLEGQRESRTIDEPVEVDDFFSVDAEQGMPFDNMNLSGLGDDIEVVMQERSISFRISSEILFPSGEAWLSDAGHRVLDRLLPVLAEVKHRINVIGHTDNLPIDTEAFPSNWELSAARAGSVVRYLEERGIDSLRLSVIGLGSTHPLQDNDTLEGRAANRRVELTLEIPEG